MGFFNKQEDKIIAENMNDKFKDYKSSVNSVVKSKNKPKKIKSGKVTYLLDFKGTVSAKQVQELRQEITAVLLHAEPESTVIICINSGGGTVTGYGLVAQQIQRLRDKKMNIIVTVDEVAASGGYMAAVVAQRIIVAERAVIGSIGVVATIPNITDLLHRNGVAMDDYTAGDYKRTVTPYSTPTESDKKHLNDKLEITHTEFKNHIVKYRPALDIAKIGTGETWSGQQAVEIGLADEVGLSDDIILNHIAKGDTVIKITHQKPKEKKKGLLKSLLTAQQLETAYDILSEKITDSLHKNKINL